MTVSSRLTKGSFQVFDDKGGSSKPKFTIAFLFNPEKITRTFTPNAVSEEKRTSKGRQDLKSVKLPTEKITISIDLDAAILIHTRDQTSNGNRTVQQYGIQPILSALQWLIYPSASGSPAGNKAKFTPKYDAPYVIFVWNESVKLPVKITNINITEQEFGPNLFPIRAQIQISMDVITSDDENLPQFIKSTYDTTVKFREQMLDKYKNELASMS